MLKKDRLIKFIGVFVFFISVLLVFKTISVIESKRSIGDLKAIPKFHFYAQNQQKFDYNFIAKDKPVCIFYYNAGCEYCQHEATSLSKHITSFNNVQILMISVNTPIETADFKTKYGLDKCTNITWVWDKNSEFFKWFGNVVTPSTFIYDKDHKLLKQYNGEVRMEAVLRWIKNA